MELRVWPEWESVQANLRIMVKRILKKYKYPPDKEKEAIQLVVQQAALVGEQWAA